MAQSYSEFRQKLIDLVREFVTQLPESRPAVETLAKELIMIGSRVNPMDSIYAKLSDQLESASNSSAAPGLEEQLTNLYGNAQYALSYGCDMREFERWKYQGDLGSAIKEALERKR